MNKPSSRLFAFVFLFAVGATRLSNHAADLFASDGGNSHAFGGAVGISGTTAFVGAYRNNNPDLAAGTTYIFTDALSKPVEVRLGAFDGAAFDYFGYSVAISGSTAIAGTNEDANHLTYPGAAYIIKDVTGSRVQLKLTPSDGKAFDQFGSSVGISGTTAIVGAYTNDAKGTDSGSAYLYKDVTGNPVERKLTAADGAAGDYFGWSVGISGSTAIVGAYDDDDNGTDSGSAYVFKNLIGTPVQLKLTASDGAAGDHFGNAVAISGTTAIVGAFNADSKGADSGSAYVFTDVTGTPVQLKLTAFDGAGGDRFGRSVAISGATAIVGADEDDDVAADSGSAYLFKDVASALLQVKLTASDTSANATYGRSFGRSVAIDGDNLVVGAVLANGVAAFTGKAYTGSVSSVTTLDEGNATRNIDGLSFVSRDNWIVGEVSDFNQVTLGAGDVANVTASGDSVYVGKNSNSDNNTLLISGNLITNTVYIGSTAGNVGNTFQIASTGKFSASSFRLAVNNFLVIEGDHTNINDLLAYLGNTKLQVPSGNLWVDVTASNSTSLVSQTFSGGNTVVRALLTTPQTPTPTPTPAGDEVIYDISFSAPEHNLDQVATSGAGPKLISRVNFGTPTVRSASGVLGDRPLEFDALTSYEQIQLNMPQTTPEGYRMEFDVATQALLSSKYAFTIYLDTPEVRTFSLHGGLNKVEFFQSKPYTISTPVAFEDGKKYHFTVIVDFHGEPIWKVYLDSILIYQNVLSASEVSSIRFSMSPAFAGAINPPLTKVALDNLQVLAGDFSDFVPPTPTPVPTPEPSPAPNPTPNPTPEASRIISTVGNLSFGSRNLKTKTSRKLTIVNSGSTPMSVYGISKPAGFTGNWSGIIQPGGSHNVTITFQPLRKRSYQGTLRVYSDATGGINSKVISGKGK